MPFQMSHNAEAEAADLLLETQQLRKLIESDPPVVDERNYERVCLYLLRSADFMGDPDDLWRFDLKELKWRRLEASERCDFPGTAAPNADPGNTGMHSTRVSLNSGTHAAHACSSRIALAGSSRHAAHDTLKQFCEQHIRYQRLRSECGRLTCRLANDVHVTSPSGVQS